jgi:hypothetical protein
MISRLLRLYFAGFLLLFLVTVASAQTAVVIRRVDLRPDANSTRRAIRVLSVDEKVQLIGPYLTNGYFHVRTAQNEKGWVWGRNVEVEGALVDTLPGPGAIPHSRPPWAPGPAPATNPTPAPIQVTSLPVEKSAVSIGPSGQTAQKELNGNTTECDGPEVMFHSTAMANGPAHDGITMLSHAAYQGTDGTSLNTTFGEFKSPQAAEDELRSWAKSVKIVIAQGRKLDDQGHVVGEREEVILDTQPSPTLVFAVLWTTGSNFHEVSSSCKKKALEFEEHYKD